MPYPPPPGPPDVGEFQAIGKLPAPELPDVTGHGGEFLETDGVIPQWQPVSGVLPDQTGHAGEFLTTDGAVASWAPGGGGGGITTIGTLTTATANAAVITGGNTLQLAPADATNPGVVTSGTQSLGGIKTFVDEPITSPFDVRRFGAVPNDPTNDLALAYYAAFAAQAGTTNPTRPVIAYTDVPSKVYIPAGTWYTSVPLVGAGARLGEADIGGAGQAVTVICPGTGYASTPSLVQGFSGPVFYMQACCTAAQLTNPLYQALFPSYTTPLVGVTGQAIELTSAVNIANSCIRLHDSYPWGSWLGDYATMVTSFSLQFWVQITGPAWSASEKGIIGSRGPSVWFDRAPGPAADIAFGVYAESDGVNVKLRAYLTTNPAWNTTINMQSTGTLHSIDSGNVSLDTPIHCELDYDGSHFDFFVNGVSQGHVAATGPIIRCPWEGVNMGAQGPELLEMPADVVSIDGVIDSVRLSNVARHTGTGSFTPPTSKYTWDGNTMALYNWDQPPKTMAFGGDTMTLPFVVGQVVTGTSSLPGVSVGPLPHYIRLRGSGDSPDCFVHDLAVVGWRSCSGIIAAFAPRNQFYNLWIEGCSQYGLFISNGVSFYNWIRVITVFDVVGTGIQFMGDLQNVQSQSCGICIGLYSGRAIDINYQPTFSSFAGAVVYGALFPCELGWFSLDDEVWAFGRQIGGGVNCTSSNITYYHDNFWGSAGGTSPPFTYLGLAYDAQVFHVNDTFAPDKTLPITFSAIKWAGNGVPPTNITLDHCYILDQRVPALPISNMSGWVSVKNAAQSSNQKGLSISDVQANNLTGTFTVNGDFAYGGAVFLVPEPDANYEVVITPKSALGGTPALGSNRIISVTTRPDGFTAFFEAAPGGIVEQTYSYMVVRSTPGPELLVFNPSIPSSATNPLDLVSGNRAFGFGVTIEPISGNVVPINSTYTTPQTIVEAGTSPGSSGSWELSVIASNAMPSISIGTFAVDIDALVVNGKFFSIHNPGVHNITIGYPGYGAPVGYFNGAGPYQLAGIAVALGTQATPIHIGERFDASQPLTQFTLKNLKVDQIVTRCISTDSAIGPGLQPQAAFFGDNAVAGQGSTLDVGGFASQIANVRYGSTYYWLGAKVFGGQLSTQFGSYISVFRVWLGAQTAPALDSFCMFPGVTDIINSATATDVFDVISKTMTGEKASGTFVPPTSFLTPIDQRSVAIARVPLAGSSVYTINGRSFTVPFITDSLTTVNGFIAQIAADGPTAALFVGQSRFDYGTSKYIIDLYTKLPGTASNGYVVTVDGTNGTIWYGDVGGTPTLGLSVKTFGGSDTTCTINGVSFVANFDTDANTTINNLLARIAGDPVISALVNTSLVGGQMFTEAANAGYAGNLIAVGGNKVNTPGAVNWTVDRYLKGGSNGVITNGVANIVLCTCPPIGTVPGVTAGMKTELNSLNALINAYTGVGVTVVDVNAAIRDPGNHDNLLPAFDSGGYINDAGHAAVFTLLAPLLPGVGTAPSSLSYATNPASYANGAPIATNSPTVTGTVTYWTVSPPLPAGLSISSTTGDITGTPTTPTAAADYTVGASNTAGTITVLVNITIT